MGYRVILNGWTESITAENPVEIFKGSSPLALKKFVRRNSKNLLVGYISYDLAYKLFKIRATVKNDIRLPLIYFMAFKKWQKFHPKKSKLPKNQHGQNFEITISPKNYAKSFKKIQQYIREGEIYQINYTHRLKAQTNLPSQELFQRVMSANPVSHLAYIEGPGFEILSASPERFIKVEGAKIETLPIKGTIPLTENPQKLMASTKEAAELNMITDLLRNDLNKVCKSGSVKVTGHRLLQKCPTVWHTFSRIIGKLKPGIAPIDALLSMFPGGSVTGCPKKRAIEIIDELESTARGIYTGAIVCIHPDYLDSSIAIRTVIKKGQKLYLQVGGGIVADSIMEKEYQETLDKAASFMNILG